MHILLGIDSKMFLCFVFNDVLWWDISSFGIFKKLFKS